MEELEKEKAEKFCINYKQQVGDRMVDMVRWDTSIHNEHDTKTEIIII